VSAGFRRVLIIIVVLLVEGSQPVVGCRVQSSMASESPDPSSSVVDEPLFPLQAHLGFTIQLGEGTAKASLELAERHLNPNDVAHGAVAFTLMDTAMGAAVMSVVAEGDMCATIEIHTRFHRAAAGGTLSAEATVLTAGRRVIHLEARTVDDDGRLVASATGSFAVIPGSVSS